MPGFSAAIDYYNISVDGAIGTITGQQTVDRCNAGLTSYCASVQRLADKSLTGILTVYENQNRLKVTGVDVELNYRSTLNKMHIPLPGSLDVRAFVSYLGRLETIDSIGTSDQRAGVNGGESTGTPRMRSTLGMTYRDGGFSAFVQERFISAGIYDNKYVEGGNAANSIESNHVDGARYTDLTFTYRLKQGGRGYVETYFTVNNLFDRDPPVAPSRAGVVSVIATNPTLYDVIGRFFSLGVRARF
jgi:hypothetical protein